MRHKPIKVTSPLLPPLEEFIPYLETIWETKWLTNDGPYHRKLEKALCDYLGVKNLTLVSNGTLALIIALHALKIKGEVITTPFSFVATTHSLWWNGINPVFVDIDPGTCNLDPDKIESAITSRTSAIMPVHVYGNPCKVDEIQKLADRYGLKLIYDAAHAFGVKLNGSSILNFGDLSILSFHATKTYSTIEGGAIICQDAEMKEHLDDLKNFGFRDEVTVAAPGMNAKMNEFQAAFGLLTLKYVDGAMLKRKQIADRYREKLAAVNGIKLMYEIEGVNHNYSYFPILVDASEYGQTRDQLYERLKTHDIYTRRYFYPLISNLEMYRDLPSASPKNLPVANQIADSVLCLPIYPDLDLVAVDSISCLIWEQA